MRLRPIVTITFTSLFWVSFGTWAWAAVEKAQAKKELSLEEKLIKENKVISNKFDQWADSLDVFLAGKRVSKRPNKTMVIIENGTYSVEGQKIRNSWSFGLQLRLPNLEESWALKFATYDESEEERSVQRKYLRDSPRERNYGATVALFRKLGKIRTSFQPRIELKNPLKISHSLMFKTSAEYKNFEIAPKLEFFARPDKGVGTYHALNFTFLLEKFLSLSLLNEATYEDLLHKYTVENGVALNNKLTDKTSMVYAFILSSNNRERYHLENYDLSVSWVQVIYRNILDYQLTPHLSFPKTHGFKGLAGINLNITLMF